MLVIVEAHSRNSNMLVLIVLHCDSMVNRLAVLNESGLVNYIKFFSAIGVTLRPDDSCGVSQQIIDSSQQTSDDHNADQKSR